MLRLILVIGGWIEVWIGWVICLSVYRKEVKNWGFCCRFYYNVRGFLSINGVGRVILGDGN